MLFFQILSHYLCSYGRESILLTFICRQLCELYHCVDYNYIYIFFISLEYEGSMIQALK